MFVAKARIPDVIPFWVFACSCRDPELTPEPQSHCSSWAGWLAAALSCQSCLSVLHDLGQLGEPGAKELKRAHSGLGDDVTRKDEPDEVV